MTGPPCMKAQGHQVTELSEIPCRVSEDEPVPADNGEAPPRCGYKEPCKREGNTVGSRPERCEGLTP